ncbi:MAG: GNAT family N-acetyltransferase [Hydrogenophaga sp.]|uniref:GNAT family N-acetyltransferase n=1 Tax=Hydrogenophaga sp. TaxID=1904254 RepID=UPI00272514DA|nr:GNAT family N-acetyltransferase [Hydrogenophaga sp.]MDO9032799.1 GNAT family N-acetyltransferase [Hydrogenophaga sp.]
MDALEPTLDEALLSRIEDAGLNASAPPQQFWLDGWIVRTSPGKARRARCINAVAAGRLPADQKLALAGSLFRDANLPMLVRLTRFTQPADLDAQLALRGWQRLDESWVMVRPELTDLLPAADTPPPPGCAWSRLDGTAYADTVGALRGSPPGQRRAHAERLASSPVRYEGHVLRRLEDGEVLACGQFAREAEIVGLYDVFTLDSARGRGFAGLLCKRLLALAAQQGARLAYLQTEATNDAARRVYRRLGFADQYSYHYRQPR